MERRHNRHIELRQQREHMTTRVTTKYSEFVLEGNHIILAGIEESGRRLIVVQLLLAYLPADAGRIIIFAPLIVHGDD